MALKLRSPVLAPGGWIPAKYTCDGSDVSPPLRWTDPPSNTKSIAVIVDAQEVSAGRGFTGSSTGSQITNGVADPDRVGHEAVEPARRAALLGAGTRLRYRLVVNRSAASASTSGILSGARIVLTERRKSVTRL